MRHTRAHTANRRSHHALRGAGLVKCSDCGALHIPHRVCPNCGKYRGRVVIDVVGEQARKEAKVNARRAKEGAGHEHAHEKEEAKQ